MGAGSGAGSKTSSLAVRLGQSTISAGFSTRITAATTDDLAVVAATGGSQSAGEPTNP